MIQLTIEASKVAQEKGQKRITSGHLKKVLQSGETFDFLADIIAKIPDAPEKESKAKPERATKSEEDEDDEDGDFGSSKKRKKSRGRPKKPKDSDD